MRGKNMGEKVDTNGDQCQVVLSKLARLMDHPDNAYIRCVGEVVVEAYFSLVLILLTLRNMWWAHVVTNLLHKFLGQHHQFGPYPDRQVSFSFDLACRLTRLPGKTWVIHRKLMLCQMHIEGEWIHQMPGVVFLKFWDAQQVEVLFFL